MSANFNLNDIEKKDFCIKDTHLKVGSNLHTNTYYNFKRFFEISGYAEEAARRLLNILGKQINDLSNTTIISYGSYSNLFISKTIDLIKKGNNIDINYAIANDKIGSNLTFQNEVTIKSNILIILPSINSGGRLEKFKLKLKKWIKDNLSVEPIFFKEVFSIFNLNNGSIQEDKKLILNDSEIFCLVGLEAETCEEHKCILCYPDLLESYKNENLKKEQLKELLLFPINETTESPKLIFGLPDFFSNPEDTFSLDNGKNSFNKVFKIEKKISSVINGHCKINGVKYVNYVKGDIFYNHNRDEILKYLSKRLKNQIEQANQKRNVTIKELAFITTNKIISSKFLDDFVKCDEFKNMAIRIINYEPFNEYPENFYHFYGKDLQTKKSERLIIFYSDVIFNGSSIKELNTFLKTKVEDDGFDIILTLIDRTTAVTKKRILRRLYKPYKDSDRNPKNEFYSNFIAFFKLDVPVLTTTQSKNPIEQRSEYLKSTLNNCHIDALKNKIFSEIKKCEPIEYAEANKNKELNNVKDNTYFPFFIEYKGLEINNKILKYYRDKFSKQHLGLLKLFIYHKLSELLVSKENRCNDEIYGNIINSIPTFIEKASEQIHKDFFEEENITERNIEEEKNIVRDNVIKLLSREPFSNYYSLREGMFNYTIKELNEIIINISESDLISYKQFRKLKFYIRRTVELNSNFIISTKFISFLKNDYYNKNINFGFKEIANDSENEVLAEQIKSNNNDATIQENNFKYFIVYCFKELLKESPSRAIQLERVLNEPKNIPWLESDGATPKYNENQVVELLRDKFYGFGRILKTENIDILNSYKETFLKELFDENYNFTDQIISNKEKELEKKEGRKEEITKTLFHDAKNKLFGNEIKKDNAKLVNFQIKFSRFRLTEQYEFEEIQNSICWMLATLAYIRRQANGKPIGNIENRIKIILNTVLKIFDSCENDENNELNYFFLIEYQTADSLNKKASKIYTISSDNSQRNIEYDSEKNGLASLVLSGLTDNKVDGNIQTLLPFIVGKDRVPISFGEFYNKDNIADFNLTDAYKNDLNQFRGYFSDANLIQYFRLSDVSNEKVEGKAVLIITKNIDKELTIKNFTSFLSVEKMRLLLLIKEELLAYINTLIKHDAFIDMVAEREKNDYYISLQHGIKAYLETLFNYSRFDKSKVCKIIKNAIAGQLFFKSNYSDKNIDKSTIQFSKEIFLQLIKEIFEDDWNNYYSISQLKIDNIKNNLPSKIFGLIFTVVLPELIINMKKYHPPHEAFGSRYLEIEANGNKFTFRNRIFKSDLDKFDVKTIEDANPNKGLGMCLKILLALGFKQEKGNYCLDFSRDKNTFLATTILTLN